MIVQWFQREVFWSFEACIKGFKYCRPLIKIDGTYLYERYDEMLLIAISFDANNWTFPLALLVEIRYQ